MQAQLSPHHAQMGKAIEKETADQGLRPADTPAAPQIASQNRVRKK
jgi:hypothetical protein